MISFKRVFVSISAVAVYFLASFSLAYECGDTVTTACSSGVVWAASYASQQCGSCGYSSANVGGGCYKFSCLGGSDEEDPSPTRVSYACGGGYTEAEQQVSLVCGAKGYYELSSDNYCYAFCC